MLILVYLRSFFDEPTSAPIIEGSMVRLCMLVLVVGAAIGLARGHDVGAGIFAGCTAILSATRTKSPATAAPINPRDSSSHPTV